MYTVYIAGIPMHLFTSWQFGIVNWQVRGNPVSTIAAVATVFVMFYDLVRSRTISNRVNEQIAH